MIRIRFWSPSTDHCGSGACKAAVRLVGCCHARNAQESRYASISATTLSRTTVKFTALELNGVNIWLVAQQNQARSKCEACLRKDKLTVPVLVTILFPIPLDGLMIMLGI